MTMTSRNRGICTFRNIGALGVVSALALVGCSNGSAGGAGDTDVVRVSVSTDAGRNYNPLSAANQFSGYFTIPVYDSLFGLDENGELIPALAESFEFSDDGLTLTLELRDDVTFHDGEAFDAEAVKSFIEAGLTAEDSTLGVDLAAVDSVDAVEEHTVAFNLSEPDGALPATLAGRAGMVISPAALEGEDLARYAVGAGPYEMAEHQPGDFVRLERFDDYYGFDDDRVESVEMTIELDPEARLRAVQSGQSDIGGLGPAQITPAENAGIQVESLPVGQSTIFAYLNKSEGTPLADERVRNAISHAIDREGLNEAVFNGTCEPAGHPFAADTWYASENRPAETAEYDPDRARELLAEAGYEDDLTLSWTAITAEPYSTLAEALSGQMAEVGVDLNLTISEPTEVVNGFTQQDAYEAYSSAWPGAADPAGNVNSLLSPGGLMNPGGHESSEVAALAADGRAELDQEARADIYQEIDDIAAEQSLQIPICSLPHTMAVADHVSGVAARTDGWLDFSNLQVE